MYQKQISLIITGLFGCILFTKAQIPEFCPVNAPSFSTCDETIERFNLIEGQYFYDRQIPVGVGKVILKGKGGDGGHCQYRDGDNVTQRIDGGGGATITVEYPVGPGQGNNLEEFGILRFVPGKAGENGLMVDGSGGGGASGVWYLCPDCDATNGWTPLIVAAGGSGAFLRIRSSTEGAGGRVSTSGVGVQWIGTGGCSESTAPSAGGGAFGYNIGCVEGGLSAAYQEEYYPVEGGTVDINDLPCPLQLAPRCIAPGGAKQNDNIPVGGYGWAGGGSAYGGLGDNGGAGGGFTGGNSRGEVPSQGGINYAGSPCLGAQLVTEAEGGLSAVTTNGWLEVQFIDGPPRLTCVDKVVYELDEMGKVVLDPDLHESLNLEACGIASLELDKMEFDCAGIGIQPLVLTAVDINGNEATCNTSAEINPFSGAVDANALGFGSNTYATASIGAFSLDQFTIEAWINPGDLDGGRETILAQGSAAVDGFSLQVSGSGIHFTNNQSQVTYDALTTIDADTWTHIAISKSNGGSLNFYLDGSLVSSQDPGNLMGSSAPLVIGSRLSSPVTDPLTGVLDELRMWSIARTETQINTNRSCELIGWEDGLEIYYRFNDGQYGSGGTKPTIAKEQVQGKDATLFGFSFTDCDGDWRRSDLDICKTTAIQADLSTPTPNEAGPVHGRFTFRLSQPSSSPTTINYNFNGSTATTGVDFSGLTGSVVVPANQESITLPFTTIDDDEVEFTEKLQLNITSVSGDYVKSPESTNSSASLSILNNDYAEVSIEATDNIVREFSFDKGMFEVSLSQSFSVPVEVSFEITGTATNGEDYRGELERPLATSLTIPANTTTVPIVVQSLSDDDWVEGTETIHLIITNDGTTDPITASSTMNLREATVEILDNDDATINIVSTGNGGFVDESSSGEELFRITTDQQFEREQLFNIQWAGEAILDTDYTTPNSTSIVFPPFTNFVNILIVPIDDNFLEPNESITLSQLNPAGTADIQVINEGRSFTLVDDDNAVVTITAITSSVPEASGLANFQFNMNNQSATETTINYDISGTASNGGDYETLSGSITLAANSTQFDLAIPILQDITVEGPEEITLTLSSILGDQDISIGTPNAATVTIEDDDSCLDNGGNIIYVSTNGDNSDGSTWATAFNELQTAMDLAVSCEDPSLQVWVATGTYLPTQDKNGNKTPVDPRTKTFFLNKNIRLYGGFSGNEASLEERSHDSYSTLSADINTTPDDRSDNAYLVMEIDGTTNSITNSCIIDGFEITQGYAFSGLFIRNSSGIIVRNASPWIRNCRLTEHYGDLTGAVYIDGQNADQSIEPIIESCIFENNQAAGNAGALYLNGSPNYLSAKILNCTFNANQSGFDGGAVYVNGQYAECRTTFTNCVFTRNSSNYNGGAFFLYGGFGIGIAHLNNCTFAYNTSDAYGGAFYQDNSASPHFSNFKNTIFWGNTDPNFGSAPVVTFDGNINFSHCIVQGSGGSDNWTIVPDEFDEYTTTLGVDGGNNLDQDPLFVNEVNGDWTLEQCSPAISNGTLLAHSSDILGNPHKGNLDIGAYEYQSNLNCITVALKAMLGGPMENDRMTDLLRTGNRIPMNTPYTLANGYELANDNGVDAIESTVLAINDEEDAIVDWVFLELRSDETTIVATRSALIQRDGDIVDLDGVSPVKFYEIEDGDYYVVVKHRNHVGVMCANPVWLY